MNTPLELLKMDLRISHTKEDIFLTDLLVASKEELDKKGVSLVDEVTSDTFLLVDYTSWKYRTRIEEKPMPKYLKLNMVNKMNAKRGNYNAV